MMMTRDVNANLRAPIMFNFNHDANDLKFHAQKAPDKPYS